jgi:hypothetical protein
MTIDVSRRSLLTLGAGLGASAMLGSSAMARAPKLGTQTPYWHRFVLGDAEVTVVSDGPLPLGDPSGTFTGVSKEEATSSSCSIPAWAHPRCSAPPPGGSRRA